ncbi:hypothetical protein PVAP13_6NG041500 [Panicum virgatum]|uniref:MATH domain-containing protein n=1 Tax=Panicum virgatum TaxID=38727 RepID=A0A8T0QV35_PANVG|nr:hypothetical protein PVAP13_6NG041500 [Panicum virgatum]
MSSSIPLSGAGKPSRAASAVVARKAQGFQVFRIDSYSVTTELISGGERITSEPFIVGGRCWRVDYYPNGTDGSKDDDSDAIAVYLRLEGAGHIKTERVRADYKFSLLDLAGNAAYELPKETATFTALRPCFTAAAAVYGGHAPALRVEEAGGDPGRGYACFITKEELRKRGEKLLKDDSLAIRCDITIAQVGSLAVAPPRGAVGPSRPGGYHNCGGYESPDEMYGEHDGRCGQPLPPDDKEYIRRCLTAQRRNY